MSTNDRDTHFQGFAKLLMEELDIDPVNDLTQQIIAQRAYDLACHIALEAAMMADSECVDTYRLLSDEEIITHMTDLTSWPDTSPQ